jgi:hypothetical protein
LSADEIYNYIGIQKNNVVSTHRLFCDSSIAFKSTDLVYIKGTWYDIKFIVRTHKLDHTELLLLATRAPQVIEFSSSSSSSSTQSVSSSSSKSESSSTSSIVESQSSSSSLSSVVESQSSSSSISSESLSSESHSSKSSESYSSKSSSSTESTQSESSSSTQSESSSSTQSESSSSGSTLSESSSSSTQSESSSSSSSADTIYVCGDIDPDATGEYTQNGTYDGKPAYKRNAGTYWIWGSGTVDYYISTTKGAQSSRYWHNDILLGDYDPFGTYTGTATVSQTPCDYSSSSSTLSESSSSTQSESSSSSTQSESSSSSKSESSSSYDDCPNTVASFNATVIVI